MIQHHRGFCLLMCMVLTMGAVAQAQRGPALPDTVRTAVNATPDRQTIKDFVASQFEQLLKDENAAPLAAQNALAEQVDGTGARAPSASFLAEYTTALNDAILGLPEDASMRTRLNAAIAAVRVATVADNYQLTEAAIRLMNDRSEAVALWGMKLTSRTLTAELRDPLRITEQRLLKEIVPAVEKHPTGPMYDEAYRALSLDLHDITKARSINRDMITAVLPPMQTLFEQRVKQLVTELIDLPGAENRATLFLTDPRVFELENGEQKLKTIQLLSDHIALLTERATNYNQSEKNKLVAVIAQTARALNVALPANVKELIVPATSLDHRSSLDEIRQAVIVIHPAIMRINAYAEVTPPPAAQQSAEDQQ